MQDYVIRPQDLRYVSVLPGTRSDYSSDKTANSISLVSSIMGDKWLDNKCRELDNPNPVSSSTLNGSRYIQLYLQINHLADDLSVVSNADGFDKFVSELKDNKNYINHRHTLNCAATFARAGNPLIRFIKAGAIKSPDFEVSFNGVATLVECKFFSSESYSQREWGSYCKELSDEISAAFDRDSRSYRGIGIAIKSFTHRPNATDVIKAIEDGLPIICDQSDIIPPDIRSNFDTSKYLYIKSLRSEFNLIIDGDYVECGLDAYRQIEIYCPVPHRERFRLANLRKKASKQIKEFGNFDCPSIICLGIQNVGDISIVRSVIDEHSKRRNNTINNYYINSQFYSEDNEYTGPFDYYEARFDNLLEPGQSINILSAGPMRPFPTDIAGGPIRVLHYANATGRKRENDNFTMFVRTRDGAPEDYFR